MRVKRIQKRRIIYQHVSAAFSAHRNRIENVGLAKCSKIYRLDPLLSDARVFHLSVDHAID